MTRVMLDTTHDGLASAETQAAIKALAPGSLVALYDTGSGAIAATPADLATIPHTLSIVMIDQGFTGSPNLKANVRDCENGAWTVEKAVDKTGWDVPRPTLYIGFPDTAIEVADAGWKGDVWLVHSSAVPPVVPPDVPAGLNVIGVQWNFSNPAFDQSIIYDRTWPMADPPTLKPIAPPGQWLSPESWQWQDAVIVGRGLDNNLYAFAYNPATGDWLPIHPFPGLSRV